VTPLSSAPLLEQLKSKEFFFVSLFGGLHLVKSNFYLGAAKDILERLGDADHDYAYTRIFTALLPASVVFVPLISWFEQRYGIRQCFVVVNCIGVLHSVVIMVPSLQLQVVAFLIFTCYRAALYSFLGAFIAVCFGPANVGRVLGCSFFVGGLFTLLLIPAQYAANAFFNGSHRPLTGLLLFCCIPAGLYLELSVRQWSVMKLVERASQLAAPQPGSGGAGAGGELEPATDSPTTGDIELAKTEKGPATAL